MKLFQNEYRQEQKFKTYCRFQFKREKFRFKPIFSNSIAKLNMDIFDLSEIEMNLE